MREICDDGLTESTVVTILLVAISLILAFAIAVYGFGLAGKTGGDYSASLNVEQVNDQLVITYYDSSPDTVSLVCLNWTAQNSYGQWGTGDMVDPRPGDHVTLPISGTSGNDRIYIVGYWDDGAAALVYDKFV